MFASYRDPPTTSSANPVHRHRALSPGARAGGEIDADLRGLLQP
jgi:hypothetical protein